MYRWLNLPLACWVILALLFSCGAGVAASEKRLALVIGNASYKAKLLATAVDDAALIAQTLQGVGFEVLSGRDLDDGLLRQAFREFADRVMKAGPDAVAIVYFAGYGVQFEGENYLLPIDTEVTEASNLPPRALPLSEMTKALAAFHPKTTFIVLDAARAGPFVWSGQAGGFAWIEPEANMLIAFSAAPGTLARDAGSGYGPYAIALAEMIGEGNLTPAGVFDRVRLRVHDLTKGAQVPWDASRIEGQFKFFDRTSDAPARADAPARTARMRSQPMRILGATDAYMVALLRDTFDAYTDFLADYWQDPMTKRIRALLAVRRESITWRRTCQSNSPAAYWSYLERYPHGPHAADAGRLLSRLGATVAPPPKFARLDYDVPPPLLDELEYIERPVLALSDPAFAFEPPPPTPNYFLEPPPPEFADLKPPVASSAAHSLPGATPMPLQATVRLPGDVAAPPTPLVSDNAREKPLIKPANDVPAEPEGGQASPPISSLQAPGSANDPAEGVRRPPSVVAEAMPIRNPGTPPLAVNQVTTEESKLPMAPSSSASSLTPRWFADLTTSADQGFGPRTLTPFGEMPISVPTMFAPPSTEATIQTWGYGMSSTPTTVGLPPRSSQPAPPALSPTSLPQPTSPVAPPTSQTTGSIPLPIPRSATLEPPATRTRSKPGINTASSPSPAGADHAKQPKKPSLSRPLPSSQVVRAPGESPGASPPKP
jgi:uncharacterized caspase-like protein